MPIDCVADAGAGPSAAPAVTRVADYEPPARSVMHRRPPGPLRRHRPPPASTHPPTAGRTGLPPMLASAAAFADAALRRVLEVVDGRRSPAHLQPLLTAALAGSVLGNRPVPAVSAGPATLQRVRVQAVAVAGPPTAVEVFGTYRRGPRLHAVAGRIERIDGGAGWQVVALHIG